MEAFCDGTAATEAEMAMAPAENIVTITKQTFFILAYRSGLLNLRNPTRLKLMQIEALMALRVLIAVISLTKVHIRLRPTYSIG
jgi:hypothetical protein